MRLMVFGGAFDPLHNGHVEIVDHLINRDDVDRLCLVPTGAPVFKQAMTFSAKQRMAMLQAVFGRTSGIDISDYELKKKEPSFMIETLRFLFHQYSISICSLVVGYDQFLAFSRWHRFQDILKSTRLLVIPRDGYAFKNQIIPDALQPYTHQIDFLDILPMGVSSTDIRSMLVDQVPINLLVPDKVLSIIQSDEVK